MTEEQEVTPEEIVEELTKEEITEQAEALFTKIDEHLTGNPMSVIMETIAILHMTVANAASTNARGVTGVVARIVYDKLLEDAKTMSNPLISGLANEEVLARISYDEGKIEVGECLYSMDVRSWTNADTGEVLESDENLDKIEVIILETYAASKIVYQEEMIKREQESQDAETADEI